MTSSIDDRNGVRPVKTSGSKPVVIFYMSACLMTEAEKSSQAEVSIPVVNGWGTAHSIRWSTPPA